MLYERWREIANEHRNEIALRDLARGQQWTFAQLAAATEHAPKTQPIVYPQGPEFIFMLLRAWRAGQTACPLELGQAAPACAGIPNDCAHLKITSASSGTARLILFTGAQLAADADNIVATMGLRPEWPNLGVISLAHSYGFSNLVLPLLLHGVPLILGDSPLPESVRKAAASADAITLAAVPALWRAWLEAGAIPLGVRLAITAGAPLSLALENCAFERHGLKLHNFYGSSECGGIAYDATGSPRHDAAIAGSALSGVNLSTGADGCLEVRGAAVGQTYWPEAQASLTAGCFHTSDLADLIDGEVYLRGRLGDQINVAGRKVSPETVERALQTHPLVRECLVFGAPSPDVERTEIIVACIAGEAELGGDTLRNFLLRELPAWQIPREWIFVPTLEVNQRGKLSRFEWRERFLKRAADERG